MCASSQLSAPPPSTSSSSSDKIDIDLNRRGETLMRLFYSLSHLIQEHEQAKELECALIPIILTYVSTRIPSVRQAIDTLQKFSEDRPESLDVSVFFRKN